MNVFLPRFVRVPVSRCDVYPNDDDFKEDSAPNLRAARLGVDVNVVSPDRVTIAGNEIGKEGWGFEVDLDLQGVLLLIRLLSAAAQEIAGPRSEQRAAQRHS